MDKTIRFISLRPRSEKEILEYWHRRGLTPNEVKPLVGRLKELNLVDDEAFASWWIEQRATFRPKGRRALRAELLAKGISQEIIDRLLNTQVEEKELAFAAAGKKIKSYEKLSLLERKKKVFAFLGRRGFSWETIKEVVDELEEKR